MEGISATGPHVTTNNGYLRAMMKLSSQMMPSEGSCIYCPISRSPEASPLRHRIPHLSPHQLLKTPWKMVYLLIWRCG